MTASAEAATVGPVLSHVGIFATDADLVSRFYTAFLGMKETDRGEALGLEVIFLSADPRQHHQLVVASGRAPGQPSTVCQLSFQLPNLSSLRSLVGRFAAAGVGIQRVVDHGTSWSAYVGDPEDNTVEVYVNTPWYVPQPGNVPLDLDQPDEAIEADTKARCLADPAYQSMAAWGTDLEVSLSAGASTADGSS